MLVSAAHAETIMGTVKDANGAAVRGAFVRARRDARSKITINVRATARNFVARIFLSHGIGRSGTWPGRSCWSKVVSRTAVAE